MPWRSDAAEAAEVAVTGASAAAECILAAAVAAECVSAEAALVAGALGPAFAITVVSVLA